MAVDKKPVDTTFLMTFFTNDLLHTLVVSIGPGQTKFFEMVPERLVKMKITSLYSGDR
jgi:hypothetical protein